MKKLWLFFILLTLAGTVHAAPGESAKTIKIGIMLHLGGDFAAWGSAYLEGIEIAREEVNASGGIAGRAVDLIVEDTRFDSRLTATASKKLLDVDKVPLALISTFTEVMVAGPMFERAQRPLVVIGDSGEEIDELGTYVFSTGTWTRGFGASASQYARGTLKSSTAALLATNNPWSQSTAQTFRAEFEGAGGKITWSNDLNPSEADFRTALQQIKASGAQMLFAPITSNSTAFFQQAAELKLKLPIITAGGALDNDVIAAIPQAVEGRFVTNAYLDPGRAEAFALLAAYRKKFSREPAYPSVTGRGYDGFMAIAHALRTTNAGSGQALKDALYKVDFEAAGFHLQMSPAGGARLPVRVLEVKQGKLVPVS